MSSARIISAYEKEVSIKRWRPLGFYPFNGAVSANDSAVDAVDASLDVGEDGVPGLDEGCDAVSFQLVGDILDVLVISVDEARGRIGLSLKQLPKNT